MILVYCNVKLDNPSMDSRNKIEYVLGSRLFSLQPPARFMVLNTFCDYKR